MDTSSQLLTQENRRRTIVPLFSNKNDSSAATSASDQLELHPIGHTVSDAPSVSPRPQADRGEQSSLLDQPPHIRCWTPFPARSLVVRLFIGWVLCAIAVLVALWVLSHSRNGLFATNLQQTDVLVLWHFIPTTIATTTALAFSAIGGASLICQPYMHLLQAGGASAEESLTLDCSGPLPVVATKAIRQRHWVIVCFSAAMLLSLSFSSFTSAFFTPRDVFIVQSTEFHYTKILGQSGNINSTSAFIQALLLSTAHGTYGGAVSLPPLTNPFWTLGPISTVDNPGLRGSDPSSTSNFTLPEWYGIRSDPACDYGQVVNTTVSGLNVAVTFSDRLGKCIFQPAPFPAYYPFAFINSAFGCGQKGVSTLAQNSTLIFGRLTPSRLAQNDTTAAVVIYCRPKVTVMSVTATLDSRTKALLSVDNVQKLSSDQQQLYDPANFTSNFLTNDAWNGFSINPAINSNVPPPLIDWLNEWINLTISVYVGGQWLNQSTVLSNGAVTDLPQAYSDEMRDYYMSTLTDFYQTYLTLLAAGSYFMDAPMSATGIANVSGFQTRLFVSTPFCWGLITVLFLSTVLIVLAKLLQPRISLPINTSPNIPITPIVIRSSDFPHLGDLRGLNMEKLESELDKYKFKIEDGELRAVEWIPPDA